MQGFLYLEDGTFFKGNGFGHPGTNVGELVFNTSMTGYQDILTDPSYTGQVLTLTYPLIGNCGILPSKSWFDKVHAAGLVARHICNTPSHYRSINTLDDWLKEMGVPGICNLDTRAITRKIRNCGSMKCVISNQGISLAEAKDLCEKGQLAEAPMTTAGTKIPRHFPGGPLTVAAIDFGVKEDVIQSLVNKGCNVHLFPYETTAEEILSVNPDGIFLPGGPGNPAAATHAIQQLKVLIEGEVLRNKLPIFGISLGHQLLTLAAGGKIYKLSYGHRGSSHAVKDLEQGHSYITAQNHSYTVDEASLPSNLAVTHVNLNDGTVEGVKYIDLPVFSVQFYPELSADCCDSAHLYDYFISLMKGGANNA